MYLSVVVSPSGTIGTKFGGVSLLNIKSKSTAPVAAKGKLKKKLQLL